MGQHDRCFGNRMTNALTLEAGYCIKSILTDHSVKPQPIASGYLSRFSHTHALAHVLINSAGYWCARASFASRAFAYWHHRRTGPERVLMHSRPGRSSNLDPSWRRSFYPFVIWVFIGAFWDWTEVINISDRVESQSSNPKPVCWWRILYHIPLFDEQRDEKAVWCRLPCANVSEILSSRAWLIDFLNQTCTPTVRSLCSRRATS